MIGCGKMGGPRTKNVSVWSEYLLAEGKERLRVQDFKTGGIVGGHIESMRVRDL